MTSCPRDKPLETSPIRPRIAEALPMIELIHEPIQTDRVLRDVQSTLAGAVVVFLGTTREFTNGKQTVRLGYEAYPEMARQQLTELERQAREKWPLIGCALVHRLGEVPLGETSIIVAVSSAHRRDAFAAAEWLMDRIKQDVPIWKQEHWSDGSSEWIHP